MSNGDQVSEALLHERIRMLKTRTGDLEGKVDGLIDSLAELAQEVQSIQAKREGERTALHIAGWVLTLVGNGIIFLFSQGILTISI